ncbi:hypothetical protein GCM10009776_14730 [Microbacterium deminutum]|uniref:Uncharacterized protein n=1 Tax=Microbacterium deminutum TaxID=344164 RepID=A0ABP5BWM1_9MICO
MPDAELECGSGALTSGVGSGTGGSPPPGVCVGAGGSTSLPFVGVAPETGPVEADEFDDPGFVPSADEVAGVDAGAAPGLPPGDVPPLGAMRREIHTRRAITSSAPATMSVARIAGVMARSAVAVLGGDSDAVSSDVPSFSGMVTVRSEW